MTGTCHTVMDFAAGTLCGFFSPLISCCYGMQEAKSEGRSILLEGAYFAIIGPFLLGNCFKSNATTVGCKLGSSVLLGGLSFLAGASTVISTLSIAGTAITAEIISKKYA